jgi:hypothetical protein
MVPALVSETTFTDPAIALISSFYQATSTGILKREDLERSETVVM